MEKRDQNWLAALMIVPWIGWFIGFSMGESKADKDYWRLMTRVDWPGICDTALKEAGEALRLEDEDRARDSEDRP